MTLLSTILVIYLGVGTVLGALMALSMYLNEKLCPEHSEERKDYDNMINQTKLIAKNPKLVLVLGTVLFWPKILIRNKK